MAISTRTVRWVLVAAVLSLVLVLIAFIGYAHMRAHSFLTGLPRKLGLDIKQTTDNFTISQSSKGRTLFTLHAAKQIQRNDGKILLHDVGIVLYGTKGDRTDRIHGQEFEYDQNKSLLTAVGEVFLDLQTPEKTGRDGQAIPTSPDDESRMVHVKTRGLVFDQKAKSAATDQPIEFTVSGMDGTAVGASYDSGTGVVILRSTVKVSGLRDDRPVVLTAARAEMDRAGNIAKLEQAKYVSLSGQGRSAGSESAAGDHTVVHLTEDGTPKEIDVDGNVRLTGSDRGTVTSDRMRLALGDTGQPKDEHLAGSVRFANDEGARQQRGSAADARIQFDEQGRARHALMIGGVDLATRDAASERTLHSATLEVALGGGGKAPAALRNGVATGEAKLRLREITGKAEQTKTNTTEVKADVLTGIFAPSSKLTQLTGLDGNGQTSVERTVLDAHGKRLSDETSTAAVLKVDLAQSPDGRTQLARSEQRGSVKIVRVAVPKKPSPKKPAEDEIQHAQGDVATYEADADTLTLTGAAQLSDASNALFANQVVVNRTSGDAHAAGAVRATYLEPGSTAEPMHVSADHASASQQTNITRFFAGPQGAARMWQGGSQVEAPELDFDRGQSRLTARGDEGSNAASVHTILVDADAKPTAPKPTTPKPGAKPKPPIRVQSQEVVYNETTHQADFRGHVKVDDADGTMTAHTMTVLLAPKQPVKPAPTAKIDIPPADQAPPMALAGRVERITGQGEVQIRQPGRIATGDRIVYTADDQTFVLTGTAATPPRVVDDAKGTTTGSVLRFKNGDDSVLVTGAAPGTGQPAGATHVRTETQMR